MDYVFYFSKLHFLFMPNENSYFKYFLKVNKLFIVFLVATKYDY
jgi:hypothetical protein